MARLCKGRSSAITSAVVLLLVIPTSPFAVAQSLYERPVLIVDPGMHTAPIKMAAADAAGRFIAGKREE